MIGERIVSSQGPVIATAAVPQAVLYGSDSNLF